jgi:S-DNA-T family DNA segregation ATPase FtsK/SpoIIIE
MINIESPRFNSDEETEEAVEQAKQLLKILKGFGVEASISEIVFGPSVLRYEVRIGDGTPCSRITSLIDDISLRLGVSSVRLEFTFRGKPFVRIEVPNSRPRPVLFSELVQGPCFVRGSNKLNLAIGINIEGQPILVDLAEIPHLLIAGSKGSGVSTFINTIIASILYQAKVHNVGLILPDSEAIGLSSISGISYLMAPVISNSERIAAALQWAQEEMARRYEIFSRCGVRGISSFNAELTRLKTDIDSKLEEMPRIVIIIRELADLMMIESNFVEGSICRLAQMAHAVGIHLIIATHQPFGNILTGVIRANLPSRVAFAVSTCNDSRVILDMKGAERLLGKGDMLFLARGCKSPLRLQSFPINDAELQAIKQSASAREDTCKPDC